MYLYIKSVGNRIHGEKKYFLYQISLPSARIYKVLKNSEHRNYLILPFYCTIRHLG